MWVEIERRPDYESKSIDQLLQMYRPRFVCQSDDLDVLKKTPSEIVFEEKQSICYGKRFRLTLGRLTKGRSQVSFYAYRADQLNLPEGHRDFILNALTSAPLDTSGGSPQSSSAQASPASSPAASSH